MIKVLWIFLIFALTTNTKGFASAVDLSLSIASFPVVSADCDSTDLSALSNKVHSSRKLSGYCRALQNFSCVIPRMIRGKKGVHYCVIPVKTGIQFFLLQDSGTLKIKTFHPAKKLPNTGRAIKDTITSAVPLNSDSVRTVPSNQLTSNNLSDIFIPPK